MQRFTIGNKKRVLEEGIELLDIEEPYRDEKGELRWISTSKKPIYDADGKIVGLIGISRDITKRKFLEDNLKIEVKKQLKSLREKDKLIAQQNKLIAMGEMIENIAHQWRQPLNSINASVMLLDDKLQEYNIDDTEIENELDEIENITTYMTTTIDDFRNFYAKEKKKTTFSLKDSILKTVSIVKKLFKYNNVSIVYSSIVDVELYSYKSELEQALLVILNNARDALVKSETKDKKIEISVINAQKETTIIISDNAGGIKEEYLSKVFEPYFTTKHKTKGTGLGLYTSKMIVEQSMGGLLLVENTEDGALFKIILRNRVEGGVVINA